DEVTSGLDFVGIRIPNHVLALELLNTIDFPLAAPSANPFSYVSPTSAQHVENQLGSRISYILDGGPCTVGIESTIVSFEHPESPTILRFGGLSQEDIEACIGKVKIQVSANSNPKAPGQLDKHYATTKPTRIVEVLPESADAFVISFGEDAGRGDFNLSATGNLIEAARNLFAALRLADESHHISIVAQLVLNQGLGRAINDRLKRAAVV
ncbi:MAG: L-threonylcarbamoyladenylate synthase, partial [Bacteroidia bacterium]